MKGDAAPEPEALNMVCEKKYSSGLQMACWGRSWRLREQAAVHQLLFCADVISGTGGQNGDVSISELGNNGNDVSTP